MSSWSRQIPFLDVLYGAAVVYVILLAEAGRDSHATLLTRYGHRWDGGLRVQGRGGVKTKAALLTQELICSIYIRAGPRDSGGFWQWLSLWFSVSSSDIRVNDILDRLLGGGLRGWRTHLGFNKLPSPEGVLVSPPLLCKLRKRFFSHLQGGEREREW